MKNWKPEANKRCKILVGEYKDKAGLILEKSKHIPGKGHIFRVEHFDGTTFVNHSYLQNELGPQNPPVVANEKAPTVMVDAECLAGLIRAAELLESKEIGIWDDKAREALAFARKVGLCAVKAAAVVSEKLEPTLPSIPMILHCPSCHTRHIDQGSLATTEHRTHACQSCGVLWAPAVVPTVGVQFLPGCKDVV